MIFRPPHPSCEQKYRPARPPSAKKWPLLPDAGLRSHFPLTGSAYLLLRMTSSRTAAAAASTRATIFVGSIFTTSFLGKRHKPASRGLYQDSSLFFFLGPGLGASGTLLPLQTIPGSPPAWRFAGGVLPRCLSVDELYIEARPVHVEEGAGKQKISADERDSLRAATTRAKIEQVVEMDFAKKRRGIQQKPSTKP